MEAIELSLRPTNGTDAANDTPAASAGGASSNDAPDRAPAAPPATLSEAVAALPLSGSGELTREMLAPVAETGDVAAVVLRCADELAWLPGLVEAAAAEEAQAVAQVLARVGVFVEDETV